MHPRGPHSSPAYGAVAAVEPNARKGDAWLEANARTPRTVTRVQRTASVIIGMETPPCSEPVAAKRMVARP